MPDPASSSSLADVVERAVVAYDALADLGETVDGEWQYVTDLRTVYGAELRGLADAGPGRAVSGSATEAVDLVIEEVGLITDPHRAIDWLSTFPQVVRLALSDEGGDA